MKEYKLVQFGGKSDDGIQNAGAVEENAGSVFQTFTTPESEAVNASSAIGGFQGNPEITNGETSATVIGGVFGGVSTGDNGNTFGASAESIGATASGENRALPQKVGVWGKVKNFLFSEVKVELTPKEQKVLKEVHDFWFQDIYFPELHDFLFQDITLFGKKNSKK